MWVRAPASTTVPSRARITPELATLGATRAARPVSRTVMWPRLTIRASGLAGMSNCILPAMKFCRVMPEAVTRMLAAFTSALSANTTPERFSMITWPFALMLPAMADGCGPVTRFSTTAPAPGWRNTTPCFWPTSKLFQSTTARWDCWVISVELAVLLMAALPAVTAPPCGRALGAWARAGRASTSRAAACSAVPSSSAARLRRAKPIRTAETCA